MKDYLSSYYSEGESDLATAFVLRCMDLCHVSGTTAACYHHKIGFS